MFLSKSGVKSLGFSAMDSIKHRLFSRSRDSTSGRGSDGSKDPSKNRYSRGPVGPHDKNYTELEELSMSESQERLASQRMGNIGPSNEHLNDGIIRRDDYDVTFQSNGPNITPAHYLTTPQ